MPANIGRLKWDETGDHFYETGISQGVLYVGSVNAETGAITWGTGVPWNGLISVSETPDGGDAEDFYADNIKYLSLRGVENFGGTITCYQTPEAFDTCDGTTSLVAGLTIGQQSRTPFCMAYKTQIGNDLAGSDYGYEIHVIYNATASPSEREYQTINDSPEPAELSFEFTTTPIPVTLPNSNVTRTSIAKISSKKLTAAKMTAVENALFGESTWEGTTETKVSDPTLKTPNELFTIISSVVSG